MSLINERYRKVLKISLPAAMHNFMNMVQSMVDMLFVGQISAISLAAVGVSMQYMGLMYAFMSLLYVGTNALVSRFFGARDMSKAGETIFMMIILSFLLSTPTMLVVMNFGAEMFGLLNTGSEVAAEGVRYLSVFAYGIPAMFVMGVLFSGMNAIGDTKIPLYISISGNILNVFLDYVLIFGKFGFKPMGVEGAALATVFTIYFQLCIYLYVYLWLKKLVIKPRFDFSILRRALKVGVPTWLERMSSHPSYLVLSALVAKYGVDALAGYQIGLRIEGLAFMPGVGFMIAGMALVGQGLGASQPEEAEGDAVASVVMAAALMGFIGLIMAAFPHQISSIFTDNQGAIDNAAIYLRLMGISQVPLAVCFVLSGCLRGAGDTKYTFMINIASLWGLRILPAWALSYITSSPVWIYAVAVAETCVRAILLFKRFRKGDWKKIKV